jgi:hypothetical protein
MVYNRLYLKMTLFKSKYVTDIPVQAWTGPYGSRRLRLLESIDNWYMKVARLAALCEILPI